MVVAASRALVDAIGAAMLPAVLAGDCTVAAKRGITVLTIVAVVRIHGTTTIRARDAVPIVQFHIGAAPAIGVEHLRDQHEKVVQARFGQRGPDGHVALALANLFTLDVRMGDVVALGGRIRIEGHDAIRLSISQTPPVQPDLKGS